MLGRLLPLMLLAGGGAAAIKASPTLKRRITNVVNNILIGSELNNYARQWQMDSVLGMSVPQPGNARAVAEWCRTATKTEPGRDAALDLYGQPYVLEKGEKPRQVIWRSYGANQRRDACKDPVEGEQAVLTVQSAAKQPDVDPGAASNKGPDDLCETAERAQ